MDSGHFVAGDNEEALNIQGGHQLLGSEVQQEF